MIPEGNLNLYKRIKSARKGKWEGGVNSVTDFLFLIFFKRKWLLNVL